jgi:photosystem II stability/assembly factor-like uncharacterized protein
MPSFAAIRPRICLILALLLAGVPHATAQPAGLPRAFLDAFAVRPIGPANMGGRITALAVVETKPSTMYVASASGGLWKTVNQGITWAPVFDGQPVASLGDVAVAPSNPDVVWVGAGEANARNSVSWGDGVYKSTDAGKSWQNMGLRDSHHIGKIVIHPKNADVVYVAALGHLWGPSKERGLYVTRDGGKSWEQSKFLDEETGFIDLAMDPGNPDILYAAAYRVRRDAFSGGNPAVQTGPAAGLYKTADGGKTWQKLTRGLPDRPLGRCGLAVSRKDPRVLYAVVQTDRTTLVRETEWGQPARRSAQPDTGGVFRSADRGETWTKLNDLCPRPFYFSQVRVDPADEQRVLVLGVTLHLSTDGGRTFRRDTAPTVHADHHALWINPANPEQLLLGTDGGLYISFDRGATWEHIRNLPIAQFYAIGLDSRKPYRVYGGLQDNGTWGGPTRTYSREGITPADWFRVYGADGFHVQPDPGDPDTVYAEGQYGNLLRINVRSGETVEIRPLPGRVSAGPDPARLGVRPDLPFRFNWSAPILLSQHSPGVVYFGGNHVFRSTNRGDLWTALSPDLTRGRPGRSPDLGHTLTTLAQSPRRGGVLWAGSDDGTVHVSRDGGRTWADVSDRIPGVPPERWITRIECSPFAEGTAYLTLDRHRNDDRAPYVFKTEDYGQTWKSLAGNLPPGGPVHVIRADRLNRDLLFLGTEFGLFVSLDAGGTWQPFGKGLPAVAVHDLAIHPRDRELVVATHGRSLYVIDISPLQELTPALRAAGAHLFAVKPATLFRYRAARGFSPGKDYLAPNPEFGAGIWYLLKESPPVTPSLRVLDAEGNLVISLPARREPGLHRAQWALRRGTRMNDPLVAPGEYRVQLKVGEQEWTQKVRLEAE